MPRKVKVIKVIINSGATRNFILLIIVIDLNIPIKVKENLYRVTIVNRELINNKGVIVEINLVFLKL
jgi:hypothetical protein